MKALPFVAAAMLALAACPPLPAPHPVPPDADSSTPAPWPFGDAGPVPIGYGCAQACAALAFVACPEGTATTNGQSCDAVCESVQGFPRLRMPTACVSKARTIDEVRSCGVKCR